MGTNRYKNMSFREVQAAITSISFPNDLKELRSMGTKWLNLVGQDWITDMEVLLDFTPYKNKEVMWIAPKWLSAGDILFFYHTKTALNKVKKCGKEMRHSTSTSNLSGDEISNLDKVLRRSLQITKQYGECIFGFAEVSGRSYRMHDEHKHFHGTIYAPLGAVYIFEHPLNAQDFKDIVRIGQNTTTPIYNSEHDSQFDDLKARLSIKNNLPDALANTKAAGLGFRDVNSTNWPEISCHQDTRFVDEAQIRTYLLDFILQELHDPRTPILVECNCYRNDARTGIADYFIKIHGQWIPVEAKLNILVEDHIQDQVSKYTHIDAFEPTKRNFRGQSFSVEDSPFCLIMDQAGIYLTRDGQFVECTQRSPKFKREDIDHSTVSDIRKYLQHITK